jgi:uncharacterized membrane protein
MIERLLMIFGIIVLTFASINLIGGWDPITYDFYETWYAHIIIFLFFYIGIFKILVSQKLKKSNKVVGSKEEEVDSILKKRYANGEISQEEFKRIKEDLE